MLVDAVAFQTPMSRLDDMAQQLRLRICLMDPAQNHILHETALAEEFGVSRTPVRQVLQRLAYEHLVETRTGVGTVVPKLAPEGAAHDFRVLAGALDLAAQTAAPALDIAAQRFLAQLSVLTGPADPAVLMDAPAMFALHSWLIAFARMLNPEPIMADAAASLHWRAIRRLLQQDRTGRTAQARILDRLCRTLHGQTDARAVLQMMALAMRDMGQVAAGTA